MSDTKISDKNKRYASGENEYYRFQNDKQIVISRNEEQQRILDHYFVVKNLEYYNTKFLTAAIACISVAVFLALIMSVLMAFNIINYENNIKLTLITGSIIIALIVASGILFVSYKNSRHYFPDDLITHNEYEQIVSSHISSLDLKDKGLKKLGVSESDLKEYSPVVFKNKIVTKTSLTVFNPADCSIHSSTQCVLLLYFTEKKLFVYKYQFDMCCSNVKETTNEFNYADICDIETFTSKNTVKNNNYLYVSSRTKFSIKTSGSEVHFNVDNDLETDEAIRFMIQKIREGKDGDDANDFFKNIVNNTNIQ